MKATREKKISLVKCSAYSIGLYVTILLGQIYFIIRDLMPSAPIYIGPIYLPLLISCMILLLLIAAGALMIKQHRNRETTDELAILNQFKAGYITKYVCVLAITIVILLVKDFNLILREDVVGNVLRVILICFSFAEMVHHLVFIILEKK